MYVTESVFIGGEPVGKICHNRSEQSGGGQYFIDGKPLWFRYEVEEREPGVWVQRAVQP